MGALDPRFALERAGVGHALQVRSRASKHRHSAAVPVGVTDRVSELPSAPTPSRKLQRAQLEAKLITARQRREDLHHSWAAATYSSSGTRRPEDVEIDLAQVDAEILELEERRAALEGAPTEAPPNPSEPGRATPELEPEYVGTRDAARLLGISPRTLEGLRARGEGPPHTRIGKRVLYPLAALRNQSK
jgi:hypothetical protein